MSRRSWIGHALGGRYRIEELLGQGGMSAVYKANDPNLRRYVAVKLIHSHLSDDPEFVRRFETEAAAVAQLRHANIIQVFDFDHEDENYYMVLEYVAGETLQQRLMRLGEQNRPLPVTEIVKIGASVADAIDYAHKRGMIHRDVKPANVMLNVQGEAILMDFGIAKMVEQTHFTATGALLGTALYMSPEQIRGERADYRCDIYSLGVTLFEMASGRLPFEADSAMTVMMMHLNDPVPNLLDFNPNVAPPIKGIIEKALAKNPDDRFQSADQLARALRSISDDGPVSVGDSPTTVPAAPKIQVPDKLPQPPVSGSSTADSSQAAAPGPAVAPPERSPAASGASAAPGDSALKAGRSAARQASSSTTSSFADSLAGIGATRLALLGAALGGGGIIVLIIGIVILFQMMRPGGTIPVTPTERPTASSQASPPTSLPVVVNPTDTPLTPSPTATSPLAPALTPTITNTSLPTLIPTATIPFVPFARIQDIFIGDDRYVVVYETFGFEPALGGQHIHFFYDTVSEANAGNPGSGPWVVYGGPAPFRDLRVFNKPADATQICVRVANPNHSIILGSGNCFDLPPE